MIPSTGVLLQQNFQITEQPTKTYKLELDKNRVRNYTEKLEAMQQAIYHILQTERYQYTMFSWNYGIETLDLYGEPLSFICPELERRITEALLWDSRITAVGEFQFDTANKGSVLVTFTVHTIFGSVTAEKEVSF